MSQHVEDATEGGPRPELHPLVKDVMSIIESSPRRRHYVWFALYAKLSADRPDIPEKTSEGLLRAIMRNIEQERAAWSRLEFLNNNPRIEDLVMASPQRLSDAICELAGISMGDGDVDPLLLLAERDEELWEWARDLETELERLAEQASRVRRRQSANMMWRREWIMHIWTAIHGMLIHAKMEPQLRQLLGDLELYTVFLEEDTLPARTSSPERVMIGSLPWSPDLEEEEAAAIWGRSNDSSLPDVYRQALDGPYSPHANAAQDQEVSREVPRTVIDLTGLDD
ncbi:hypothetical protein HDV63DRAFT_264503 [Trichoderma sp. SZMC 28014]